MKNMFDLISEAQHLINDGYKMVAQYTVQEPLVEDSMIPYSGEYGTGYIIRYAVCPNAQYHYCEVDAR